MAVRPLVNEETTSASRSALSGDTIQVPGNLQVDGTVSGPGVDYVGRFESATIGTGDIPLNKWGWWWKTDTSELFIVRNRGGVLYAVEANPLP